MRALVIGAGNAGMRHATLLASLGCDVEMASRRESLDRFNAIASGRENLSRFDRVVIATESSNHETVLSGADFDEFRGRVLIEKPARLTNRTISKLSVFDSRVAYNLRYLEGLRELKAEFDGSRSVLRLSVRAHSFLPDWRADSSSRDYYSRHADLGGGALLDLSHELDYIGYLVGPWSVSGAVGGRLGDVTVDADDSWFVIGQSASGAKVNLSLSTMSKLQVRDLLLETAAATYELNLILGSLKVNQNESFGSGIRESYQSMMEDFLFGENLTLPTLSDHALTLQKIDEIRERAGALN